MGATLARNAFSRSSETRRIKRPLVADGRWRTRFAKLMRKYGVARMSKDLQVDPSVIYQWIRGAVRPRPDKAFAIIMLVRPLGRLRLEEIYDQREVHKRAGRQGSPQNSTRPRASLPRYVRRGAAAHGRSARARLD